MKGLSVFFGVIIFGVVAQKNIPYKMYTKVFRGKVLQCLMPFFKRFSKKKNTHIHTYRVHRQNKVKCTVGFRRWAFFYV